MKFRGVLLGVVMCAALAATAWAGEPASQAGHVSYADKMFDISLSAGAIHVETEEVMFGSEVGSFLATIGDGKKIENKGWAWQLGGSFGANLKTPATDRIWLEAEYWQRDEDNSFNRATTPGGTYYFAPLLKAYSPARGALFNTISGATFENDAWSLQWNLLAKKNFVKSNGVEAGLVYGAAFRYFSSDFSFRMTGAELAAPLTLRNNTDLTSFGVGPAVGVSVGVEAGHGVAFEFNVLGKLYHRWNDMEARQRTAGGLVVGTPKSEHADFDETKWSPSAEASVRVTKTYRNGLMIFLEGKGDYQTGLPTPVFAKASDSAFLARSGRTGLDDFNALDYGVKLGIGYRF